MTYRCDVDVILKNCTKLCLHKGDTGGVTPVKRLTNHMWQFFLPCLFLLSEVSGWFLTVCPIHPHLLFFISFYISSCLVHSQGGYFIFEKVIYTLYIHVKLYWGIPCEINQEFTWPFLMLTKFRSIYPSGPEIEVIKLWPDIDTWRPSMCDNSTSRWPTDVMLMSF